MRPKSRLTQRINSTLTYFAQVSGSMNEYLLSFYVGWERFGSAQIYFFH